MPKYNNNRDKSDEYDGRDEDNKLVVPESWTEPRCHVCQSKYRRSIDKMLALGTNFSEIERVFGGEIDRRSISRHSRKHLGYEDAAIRSIIEREAQEAGENAEQGISGAVARRTYLEIALKKATESLINEKVMVETKDALGVIETLTKLDGQTHGAQLDEIKVHFNAFVQAIREISAERGDPSLGNDITARARQIAGIAKPLPIAEKSSDVVVEAHVVENDE